MIFRKIQTKSLIHILKPIPSIRNLSITKKVTINQKVTFPKILKPFFASRKFHYYDWTQDLCCDRNIYHLRKI